MNTLQFAYVSVQPERLPSQVRQLLDDRWEVTRHDLQEVATQAELPDLTWVTLDTSADVNAVNDPLETLFHRVESADSYHQLYLTVSDARGAMRRRLLDFVRTAKRPERIELDLAGVQDLDIALARFEAFRLAEPLPTRPAGIILNRPAIPNADLRTERGNLSASRIAEVFGVSLTELGAWIGKKKTTLSRTPDAPALQSLLAPLEGIARMRGLVADDDAFRKWLRTDHRLLEGKSPLHWVQQGRLQEIADFVDDALTGQPS